MQLVSAKSLSETIDRVNRAYFYGALPGKEARGQAMKMILSRGGAPSSYRGNTFGLTPADERVFEGTFFHTETRQVQETYYVQEPYTATESYSCGTGTSYRSCTRTVTQYRSVAKTRWVTKDEVVVDGMCESSTSLAPANGHIYLLQYTYQDRSVCSLACFEQIPQGDDRFDQKPCAVTTPTAK